VPNKAASAYSGEGAVSTQFPGWWGIRAISFALVTDRTRKSSPGGGLLAIEIFRLGEPHPCTGLGSRHYPSSDGRGTRTTVGLCVLHLSLALMAYGPVAAQLGISAIPLL
jgi:hypothetical protein